MLGTTWTSPSEGSTWRELANAFIEADDIPDDELRLMLFQFTHGIRAFSHGNLNRRTNLLLTGAPIAPYDLQRWESGNVH